MRSLPLLTALLVAAPLALRAEREPGPPPPPGLPADAFFFAAGVAGLYSQSPYTGVDDRWLALPVLRVRTARWEWDGPRLAFTAWRRGPLALALVARWDFAGFDAGDSPLFAGLREPRDSLLAGLRFSAPLAPGWRVQMEALGDTLGRHDGALGALGVQRRVSLLEGRVQVSPTAEVEWHSSSYNDTYYGVPADRAIPGRPAYRASSGFNPRLGVQGLWRINEQWSAWGALRLTWLDDAVRDSPLVEEARTLSALVAVSRAFP
jgi:outer membrane scaffolding protein for murein synthesis (MipA/OmpV family)